MLSAQVDARPAFSALQWGLALLQYYQRDRPTRLGRESADVRVLLHYLGPKLLAFATVRLAGSHGDGVGADLNHDVRAGPQVVSPRRLCGGTAVCRDHDQPAAAMA
jgi:hypothetical protein